jgi:hypothetical protein
MDISSSLADKFSEGFLKHQYRTVGLALASLEQGVRGASVCADTFGGKRFTRDRRRSQKN